MQTDRFEKEQSKLVLVAFFLLFINCIINQRKQIEYKKEQS